MGVEVVAGKHPSTLDGVCTSVAGAGIVFSKKLVKAVNAELVDFHKHFVI
jgi:hypothetical protein